MIVSSSLLLSPACWSFGPSSWFVLSQPDDGLGSLDTLDGNFNLIAVANGIQDHAVQDLEVCDRTGRQSYSDPVVRLVHGCNHAVQNLLRRRVLNGLSEA